MPPRTARPTTANAGPSTALHLLTSTRPPEPQANRSTAPANRSIRFTSLRFHGAQSVSAVQRKRTLIGAALRFAPFAQPCRARGPTNAGPHCPHSRNTRPQKPTTSALQAFLHLRGKNSFHSAAAPRVRSTQLHEATRYGSRRCRALYQKSDSTMSKSKAP